MVKKIGAYLPGAYEEVVDVVDAYVLTEKVMGWNSVWMNECTQCMYGWMCGQTNGWTDGRIDRCKFV